MRTRLFARLLLVLAPECISAMRPQRPDLRPPRPAHAQLTLIRHGQSEWNLANRFTGWMDVDLTERGIIEARQAGRMLRDEGLTVDLVCTSCLQRAVRSACLVLSVSNQCFVPMEKDLRLNEQHSGMLTGHNKRDLARTHGVEQVMKWRRSPDCQPPPLAADNPFQKAIVEDERYRDTTFALPQTESFEMVVERVQDVWDETIAPALRKGRNVMVVSHGNTLRALVALVDSVGKSDTYHLDLPTASPVVYDLDAALQPMRVHGTWGGSETARGGRFLMNEDLVSKAVDAMRQQCLQNIAVSTVDPATGENAIEITDASADASSSKAVVTSKEGRSYNVRTRPPTYFTLESERIQSEARQEVASFVSRHLLQALSSAAGTRRAAVPKATLIIVRHGYSEYNMENLFTGWADCDLTNRGKEEARFAGSLLREAGVVRLERVFTSSLKRAIKSAWLMLDELELQWVPITMTWRLNERHYGALQGQPKRLCSERYGQAQVQKWRRGIRHPPPPWSAADRDALVDRRYAGVPVPETESLADCTERLLPFLEDELWPAMREAVARAAEEADEVVWEEARRQSAASSLIANVTDDGEPAMRKASGGVPAFAIASSENLIRALVAELEGVPEADVPLLDIPYATPLVYQLDEHLRPIPSDLAVRPLRHGYYLGDAERIEKVQQSIRESIACVPPPVAHPTNAVEAAAADADPEEAPCGIFDTCFAREGADGQMHWTCEEPPPAAADAALGAVGAAGADDEEVCFAREADDGSLEWICKSSPQRRQRLRVHRRRASKQRPANGVRLVRSKLLQTMDSQNKVVGSRKGQRGSLGPTSS